jgi:hypothetical protein
VEDVEVRPNGVDAERSVFVEVFAQLGRTRVVLVGGQVGHSFFAGAFG